MRSYSSFLPWERGCTRTARLYRSLFPMRCSRICRSSGAFERRFITSRPPSSFWRSPSRWGGPDESARGAAGRCRSSPAARSTFVSTGRRVRRSCSAPWCSSLRWPRLCATPPFRSPRYTRSFETEPDTVPPRSCTFPGCEPARICFIRPCMASACWTT